MARVSRAARKVLGKHKEKCPRCKGKGEITLHGSAGHGKTTIIGKHKAPCPDCDGTGWG